MTGEKRLAIAVLDDYQNIALKMADWSALQKQASVTVFEKHTFDRTELIKALQPFDVLCIMRERTAFPREVLEQLPNLKLIASSGRRNLAVDTRYARERGIVICGTESPAQGTATLTWALLLALARNVIEQSQSVRSGGWQVAVGTDLDGKTLGLLGLGRLGSKVAQAAPAFGLKVIAWSQNLTAEIAAKHGATLVTKEELFRESDFVSLHVVLSKRTRGIVGRHELGLMKPSAYLINTARGPLVEESALIEVLSEGRIAGAALDVFDEEPLPIDHPLRKLPNVIATPHIGYVTEDTYRVFYSESVENIEAWIKGTPIRLMTE